MKKYAVIYLDILGFKSFSNEDSEAALRILKDFHTVLKMRRQDEHSPSSMSEGLEKRLAARNASDSFSYFLPMSDSVFILSEEPDKVAAQLSTFLRDSFLLGGHAYDKSDTSNVFEQCIKEPRISESGKVEINYFKENWYPVLFRGGISYGDVKVLKTPAICNEQEITVPNVIGQGVVQAVGLEQRGLKGPRILCDCEFVDQLRGPATKYLRKEGDAWELLWPGFNYFEGNDERSERYNLDDLFGRALALWRHFSGEEPEKHYRAFLELIVQSHLAFAKSGSESELINEELLRRLNKAGLKLSGSDLNSKLVFPNTNRKLQEQS